MNCYNLYFIRKKGSLENSKKLNPFNYSNILVCFEVIKVFADSPSCIFKNFIQFSFRDKKIIWPGVTYALQGTLVLICRPILIFLNKAYLLFLFIGSGMKIYRYGSLQISHYDLNVRHCKVWFFQDPLFEIVRTQKCDLSEQYYFNSFIQLSSFLCITVINWILATKTFNGNSAFVNTLLYKIFTDYICPSF